MTSETTKKILFYGCLCLLGLALKLSIVDGVFGKRIEIRTSRAMAESATSLKKSEDKIRAEMIVISRQLGVTCTECHNVQNFKSDEKKNFKIGLEHMKITALLKEKGFDGKKGPEASCYMCHQGELRPEFKEDLSANEGPKASAH